MHGFEICFWGEAGGRGRQRGFFLLCFLEAYVPNPRNEDESYVWVRQPFLKMSRESASSRLVLSVNGCYLERYATPNNFLEASHYFTYTLQAVRNSGPLSQQEMMSLRIHLYMTIRLRDIIVSGGGSVVAWCTLLGPLLLAWVAEGQGGVGRRGRFSFFRFFLCFCVSHTFSLAGCLL